MLKLKIKIFQASKIEDLEVLVNEFLEKENLVTENFINLIYGMAPGQRFGETNGVNKLHFSITLIYRKQV